MAESHRRMEPQELPDTEATKRVRPERVYLYSSSGESPTDVPELQSLHPLLVFDTESGELLFLNSRRGRERVEYLGYTSGQVIEREKLQSDHRELLARIFNAPVDE